MKKEELTAIGLTDEQADKVFALHGKDTEKLKADVKKLEEEKKDLSTQLDTAKEAIGKFEGKTAEQVKEEIEKYKQASKDAEESFKKQLADRDKRDWLKAQFESEDFHVEDPYARDALMREIMSEEKDGPGLKWKDGEFMGFGDYMAKAKEKSPKLYLSKEEREAKAKEDEKLGKGPKVVGKSGDGGGSNEDGQTFVRTKVW